jgi:hypothetical protein
MQRQEYPRSGLRSTEVCSARDDPLEIRPVSATTARQRLAGVGVALLVGATLSGAIRFALQVPLPSPPRAILARYARIRAELPARGFVNYHTIVPPAGFGELIASGNPDVGRAYIHACIAMQGLAPIYLLPEGRWRPELEWAVGNYLEERWVPPVPDGFAEALRVGDGLVLYRRR